MMETIMDITKNALLQDKHSRLREDLKARFPELADCPHDHFLALTKYISRIPQSFFSDNVYSYFLSWLKERDRKERVALKQYLAINETELNRAFLHLEEINQLEWHDYFEASDDYELIRFVDQKIHPTYLRLTEAVLYPLLRIVAYYSRLDRDKLTDGLDIYNVVEELKMSPLKDATDAYRHTIRNGIGHGGITYLMKEIRYRDKKGNEEKYSDLEVIRLFDDLLDTCNALSLGLSVFLLKYQQHGYKLHQQLLIDELKEETRTPWWEIVGCTPSEFPGLNQLVIYVQSRTSDKSKITISSFHSGILAEYFAPNYDRYVFSIRSQKSWPGFVAFDGKKLSQLKNKPDVRLEDYKGVIVDDLIFFVPRFKMPRVLLKLQTIIYSFQLHWPGIMTDLREKLGWPDISIRETKIHRNSWGCVLNGSVYIQRNKAGELDQDAIRKACSRIVKKSLSHARHQSSSLSLSRYLPLGFAHISVFRKNYRRRRLASFGLGSDLIGTIRIQRIGRITSPDITGSIIEKKGRYRIAWNSAWLENIN